MDRWMDGWTDGQIDRKAGRSTDLELYSKVALSRKPYGIEICIYTLFLLKMTDAMMSPFLLGHPVYLHIHLKDKIQISRSSFIKTLFIKMSITDDRETTVTST
jgi:hypothetical protein